MGGSLRCVRQTLLFSDSKWREREERGMARPSKPETESAALSLPLHFKLALPAHLFIRTRRLAAAGCLRVGILAEPLPQNLDLPCDRLLYNTTQATARRCD